MKTRIVGFALGAALIFIMTSCGDKARSALAAFCTDTDLPCEVSSDLTSALVVSQ